MKHYYKLLLAGIATLFLSNAAVARPVKLWTPSELLERSEIVMIGKPTSIKATGKTGTIQLGKNAETPVQFYSAKVEVIALIKGEEVVKEIAVEFSTVNSDEVQINGAIRFWLEEGRLFLLYLKKGDGGTYVGALDGEFDDGQAGVRLPETNTE